jgi:hypothetical protein
MLTQDQPPATIISSQKVKGEYAARFFDFLADDNNKKIENGKRQGLIVIMRITLPFFSCSVFPLSRHLDQLLLFPPHHLLHGESSSHASISIHIYPHHPPFFYIVVNILVEARNFCISSMFLFSSYIFY